MTLASHSGDMAAASDRETPLASFVLRVRGQPARLTYELLDLRSGERRRFTSVAKLCAHLRSLGIDPEGLDRDSSDDV